MQLERDLTDVVKEAVENGEAVDCPACNGEGGIQYGPLFVNCSECCGAGLSGRKVYRVIREEEGVTVTVAMEDGGGQSYPLPPRHDLYNHSPDGFEFGYQGSGPSQLALALLADALQDDQTALLLYQDFKRQTIACWKGDRIRIAAETVRSIAADLGAKREPLPDPFADAEPSDDPPEGAEVEHCGTVTLEELDALFAE